MRKVLTFAVVALAVVAACDSRRNTVAPDLVSSPRELSRAVWPFWVKSKEESLMDEAAVLLKHRVSPGRLHELVDLVTVKEVLSS